MVVECQSMINFQWKSDYHTWRHPVPRTYPFENDSKVQFCKIYSVSVLKRKPRNATSNVSNEMTIVQKLPPTITLKRPQTWKRITRTRGLDQRTGVLACRTATAAAAAAAGKLVMIGELFIFELSAAVVQTIAMFDVGMVVKSGCGGGLFGPVVSWAEALARKLGELMRGQETMDEQWGGAGAVVSHTYWRERCLVSRLCARVRGWRWCRRSLTVPTPAGSRTISERQQQ